MTLRIQGIFDIAPPLFIKIINYRRKGMALNYPI